MNDQQLVNTLAKAGFKGPKPEDRLAVAKAESGGRPEAFNPDASTGDRSYGLFQINMLGSLGPARRRQYGLKSDEDLYDPLTNARIAYRMSGGGKDWSPWSAYKSGAHGEVPQPGAEAWETASARGGRHRAAALAVVTSQARATPSRVCTGADALQVQRGDQRDGLGAGPALGDGRQRGAGAGHHPDGDARDRAEGAAHAEAGGPVQGSEVRRLGR